MEKSKRTCVLLGIGEQERKIQNAQPGVVNVIKVWRQKDKCIGKSRKVMCHFSYWSVVNAMKVWRQKDMYGQKPEWTCVFFSYWRGREGNSECTGNFHQSLETKKKRSVEAREKCAGKWNLDPGVGSSTDRPQEALGSLRHP